jgi:hypothetical protein
MTFTEENAADTALEYAEDQQEQILYWIGEPSDSDLDDSVDLPLDLEDSDEPDSDEPDLNEPF